MQLARPFFLVAIAALNIVGPAGTALADGGKFERNDGFQITIRCRDWGCSVLGKPPNGSWGLVEKGSGGALAFERLSEKYQALGFTRK